MPKIGGRVMSLQDPIKKMSKSDTNAKGLISLLDPPATVAKKIKSAVTDSDGIVKYDKENKPGISNLLSIYSIITDTPVAELEAKYEGKGYGEFKGDLAEIMSDFIAKFQKKYEYYMNSDELDNILDLGAEKANIKANKMLKKMENAMGLGRKRK